MNILGKTENNGDLKALDRSELNTLCRELRAFLLRNVSRTGGHLAANLGTVELTVALHRVYDPAHDRILFDVGHQSYTHKILTGRKDQFATLRQFGGISGFPKPCESDCDPFVAGHASDSVSVALGMARARTLEKADYDVVAVIGDGALTGGLSYEALCDAGQSGEPMVVVLNDNGMSINANVGGMAKLLSRARIRPSYIRFKRRYQRVMKHFQPLYRALHRIKEWIKDRILPDNIFDSLGFYYLGPVDGHNIEQLEPLLHYAKEQRRPVLLHVVTVKGKGVDYAEQNPMIYHGIGPFDPMTGTTGEQSGDFAACFGHALTELAEKDRAVCAITAAMETGTGLTEFADRYPERFFDVGIAEGHAAAMAGGLAKQGMVPVFAVYSTFLQRAFDMLIEDVALMGLHVVFAVDRSGLVGRDGETHQGSFGIGYLSMIPGMRIYAPSGYRELREMLTLAVEIDTGPVALCYPRGGEGAFTGSCAGEPSTVLRRGDDITVVSYGIEINEAIRACDILEERGIHAELIKLNTIRPLDTAAVNASLRRTGRLLAAEECCRAGSTGSALLAEAAREGITLRGVHLADLGSGIVRQGSVEELRRMLGLDADSLAAAAEGLCHEKDPT